MFLFCPGTLLPLLAWQQLPNRPKRQMLGNLLVSLLCTALKTETRPYMKPNTYAVALEIRLIRDGEYPYGPTYRQKARGVTAATWLW